MNTSYYPLFIHGDTCDGAHGTYEVFSPIDGKLVGHAAKADLSDLEQAIAAASACFKNHWGTLSAQERHSHLHRLAEVLEAEAAPINALMVQETGRSYGDDFVSSQAAYLRYYADLILEQPSSASAEDKEKIIVREPLGVCGGIIPFNTNVHGFFLKAAPALAAGNTVVILAAEEAPLAVLKLAEVFQKAGFPQGACSIIAGDGALLGQAMVEHPTVQLISFTGSVSVGQQIMKTAANTMKRLVLELGGKSPLILFPNIDLDRAAECTMRCAFGNQGESCCAVARVLVHRSILDEFLNKIQVLSEQFVPAYPGEQAGPYVAGPLFNKRAFERVEQYIRIGKAEGQLLFGGKRYTGEKFAQGYYMQPTAFLLPDNKGRLAREEVFGPVLCVIPFDEEAEAIEIANDVDFGLSASVWSEDKERLQRIVPQINAGTIWVNNYYQFSPDAPWGGYKLSGVGKEGGIEGLNAYYRTKTVWGCFE